MKLPLILLAIFNMHGIIMDQNLVETTCRNTPNYQLCISTLRSSPNSDNARRVEDLGLIMVDVVRAKAKAALLKIEELKIVHPELIHALRKCTNTYNAVVKADVPEAMSGLRRGVPKFAEFGMEDAAWEAEICEGSFGNVGESPMSTMNKEIHDLAEVAVAIIKNLL